MCTRYPIINRVSELKVHIELTRFVQPEKIEIDANERAVNEKSQYCFFVCTTFDSFLNDFLILRERYDEKELKDALIEKVNNFLMELGTGFAYMGREVRIEVGDTEKFIDMLFYNTQRHCYVVVEIKTGKFDSSYAGQLGTYVVAVNHQMKTEADNPTLGLLICKDMDKVEAQYALESTSQPLGISSYELSKLIPEEFKGSMPTIEEIEAELNE